MDASADALDALREAADPFARCYVALVEKLVAQGVPEDTARYEARMAACYVVVYATFEDAPEPWEE